MSVPEMVGDETSCASKIVGDVQVGGDLEKAAARSVGVQRKKTQMLLVPHTERSRQRVKKPLKNKEDAAPTIQRDTGRKIPVAESGCSSGG